MRGQPARTVRDGPFRKRNEDGVGAEVRICFLGAGRAVVMTELEKFDGVEHAAVRAGDGGAGVIFDRHEGDRVV